MGQRSGKTKDAVGKQEEKQEGKKRVPYTNHALGCNVVMGQNPSKPKPKAKTKTIRTETVSKHARACHILRAQPLLKVSTLPPLASDLPLYRGPHRLLRLVV